MVLGRHVVEKSLIDASFDKLALPYDQNTRNHKESESIVTIKIKKNIDSTYWYASSSDEEPRNVDCDVKCSWLREAIQECITLAPRITKICIFHVFQVNYWIRCWRTYRSNRYRTFVKCLQKKTLFPKRARILYVF